MSVPSQRERQCRTLPRSGKAACRCGGAVAQGSHTQRSHGTRPAVLHTWQPEVGMPQATKLCPLTAAWAAIGMFKCPPT
jgi:hypothetical protein